MTRSGGIASSSAAPSARRSSRATNPRRPTRPPRRPTRPTLPLHSAVPPSQCDASWASRHLALPRVFDVDNFFRDNEDTRWAVEEFEQRDLQGLFGPFESAYPRIVRLFYQNLVVNGGDNETLSTVIDGVTITVTPGDIAAALHSRVVSGYTPYPTATTFDEIVRGMCGGHFGRRRSHTRRAFLPARILFVDSVLKANVCVSGHREERNGRLLEALYAFQNGYELSIPDLIWGEMFKFWKGSKVRQNPSALARGLPFPTLITSLVRQYYPIPSGEDEVKDFTYFGKKRWQSSLHGLGLSGRLPPPPPPPPPPSPPSPPSPPLPPSPSPPPATVVTPTLSPASTPITAEQFDALRSELAAIRTEQSTIIEQQATIVQQQTDIVEQQTDIVEQQKAFVEQQKAFVECYKLDSSRLNSILEGVLERLHPNITCSRDNQSQIQAPFQVPISWPSYSTLTQSWVISLMQAFDWGSRNLSPSKLPSLLPLEVLDKLVLSASEILHNEPNIVRIDEFGADSRIVVVGDIKGQLHDLIFLLRDAGFPADNNIFVFNGDYVGRGAWGLETFLLLLAWKVFLPHKVYLLRGNHESKYCTSVYGFEKEVLTKYGDKGNHVYKECLSCFEGLPLASVIGGRVYTAHGGIFRSMATNPSRRSKRKKTHDEANSLVLGSLDDLSNAKRTVVNPPWEGQNLIPGDVLWSDPSMSPGLYPNTKRGMGLFWGPDCTEEFLKKCNLKLIIRSHEGPDAREKRPGLEGMNEGYTVDHVVESGRLITLFSAPDYPQFQATEERYNNKGAYIVLEPPHFDTPVFHSFEAVTPRPEANPFYDYKNVIDSDEELDLESIVS